MKKQKNILISMLLIMSLSLLVACGTDEDENVEDFPKKDIDLYVGYSAGGATDLGARSLVPYVEEELGVNINVINETGGGGWIAWNSLLKSDPDGYTLALLNTPNIVTGYLNPEQDRDNDLDDFSYIGNHVTDYSTLSINPQDDRFEDAESLINYAQEHEVTAGTTGIGSHQHISLLTLNDLYDTQFVPVHQEGSADNEADLIGGHIDVMFDTIGNMYTSHEAGEIKAIALLNDERSDFLPDVPTLEEENYPDVTGLSARGIGGPAGIDEEVLEKLREAFLNAMENEEQIKDMEKLGLLVDPQMGEDYRKLLDKEEEKILNVQDILGW